MPVIRRGLVLLLAYLVSSFVSSVAVVIISGIQQGAVVWAAQFKVILPIVLVLGLSVAWIPLTLALALTLRLWRSRLLAALCSSVFTAFVLLASQGNLVSSFLSIAVTPLYPSLWRQLLDAFSYAIIVGLSGGVAFWAIAYRGTRTGEASPSA